MGSHRLVFAQLSWDAVAPGARHKVFERDGKRLRLLELSGEFVEHQWCLRAHVGMVLEGCLAIDFADRSERFDAGDGLFIEAGTMAKHKARSVSDRVVLFLVENV